MSIYILDTETTGLDNPHLTEVAYCIIDIADDGNVILKQEPRSKRYNPLKPISLGAMATSYICDEDVENEPPHTDFRLPASVEYIVGHNIDFDMMVLRNAGVTSQPKLICTKAMAVHLLPELDSHKLTSLLYYFHREVAKEQAKNAHAAIVDIYFTRLVLQSLIDVAIGNGYEIASVEDLYRFSEAARVPTVLSFGKYKGSKIADLVETMDGRSYLNWLATRDEVDPYLLQAIKKAFDDARFL